MKKYKSINEDIWNKICWGERESERERERERGTEAFERMGSSCVWSRSAALRSTKSGSSAFITVLQEATFRSGWLKTTQRVQKGNHLAELLW